MEQSVGNLGCPQVIGIALAAAPTPSQPEGQSLQCLYEKPHGDDDGDMTDGFNFRLVTVNPAMNFL